MDPAAGAPRGPQGRARPLTAVAVSCTSASAMLIPRPLLHAMADRGLSWLTPPVAVPLLGVEPRAGRRDVLREQGRAGVGISLVTDPPTLFPRLARHHPEDGGRSVAEVPCPCR